MKNNQNKGFAFKVADKQNQTQVKTRDGVATAGCTTVVPPWGGPGHEAKTYWQGNKDAGFWC